MERKIKMSSIYSMGLDLENYNENCLGYNRDCEQKTKFLVFFNRPTTWRIYWNTITRLDLCNDCLIRCIEEERENIREIVRVLDGNNLEIIDGNITLDWNEDVGES